MMKMLIPLVLGIVGLGVGAGSAELTRMLFPPAAGPAEAKEKPLEQTAFVSTGKVVAPLVYSDGRLSGYVSIEMSLQVDPERSEELAARLPLLLNAINMRTYRTPMTSGRDGMLPNLGVFKKLVMEASVEAFGKGAVRRVAVTQAVPA